MTGCPFTFVVNNRAALSHPGARVPPPWLATRPSAMYIWLYRSYREDCLIESEMCFAGWVWSHMRWLVRTSPGDWILVHMHWASPKWNFGCNYNEPHLVGFLQHCVFKWKNLTCTDFGFLFTLNLMCVSPLSMLGTNPPPSGQSCWLRTVRYGPCHWRTPVSTKDLVKSPLNSNYLSLNQIKHREAKDGCFWEKRMVASDSISC